MIFVHHINVLEKFIGYLHSSGAKMLKTGEWQRVRRDQGGGLHPAVRQFPGVEKGRRLNLYRCIGPHYCFNLMDNIPRMSFVQYCCRTY
jgi:hypothetical protein